MGNDPVLEAIASVTPFGRGGHIIPVDESVAVVAGPDTPPGAPHMAVFRRCGDAVCSFVAVADPETGWRYEKASTTSPEAAVRIWGGDLTPAPRRPMLGVMKIDSKDFKLVLASMAREGCTFRGVDGATMLAVAPDGSNRATVRYKLDGNRKRSAAIEMPHKDLDCGVEKRQTFADDAVGAVCEALTKLGRGTMTGAGLRAASPLFDAICKEADELETPCVAERLRALAAAGATFTLAGFGRLVVARPGKGAYDALASLSAGCTMAVLEERGKNASTITKSVAASDRDALGALIDALADGPLDGGAALAVLGGDDDVCTPCAPGDEPDAVYDPVVKALKDVMEEGSRFVYACDMVMVAIGPLTPEGAPHRAVFLVDPNGALSRTFAVARVAVADDESVGGWRYEEYRSKSPEALAALCDTISSLKGDAR